jgi:hypothetical protein
MAAALGSQGRQATDAVGAPAGEVMAHVEDERSGTIAVYAGTRKVTIQDRSLANALVRALS